MHNLEDRLIREIKEGSKKAFEYVFKTYYADLCKYAEELLKNSAQAEDVVINLFVVIWEDRERLYVRTSLKSYLYKGVYNSCLNVIRQRKSHKKYVDFFINHSSDLNVKYGSGNYPLSDIIDREFQQIVENAIDQLPPRRREIFIMSRKKQLSHKQIASKLNLSENTVKSHIMNALKQLESVLKKLTG